MFIKNKNGKQGRVKRQCTKEYKIQVVDRIIRRTILGLLPRQRAPKRPVIEHWFGITTDERQRAVYPGQWKKKRCATQGLLFDLEGKPLYKKEWRPTPWEIHVYPLLDQAMYADRKCKNVGYLPREMHRFDCQDWLKKYYPERTVPRSACLGCPFRTNAEWKRMRDESPEEWADAVAFDRDQRVADRDGPGRRGLFVGEPYIHRQLIPLDMVNLDGDGEKEGTSCGMLGDGFDGMCGV